METRRRISVVITTVLLVLFILLLALVFLFTTKAGQNATNKSSMTDDGVEMLIASSVADSDTNSKGNRTSKTFSLGDKSVTATNFLYAGFTSNYRLEMNLTLKDAVEGGSWTVEENKAVYKKDQVSIVITPAEGVDVVAGEEGAAPKLVARFVPSTSNLTNNMTIEKQFEDAHMMAIVKEIKIEGNSSDDVKPATSVTVSMDSKASKKVDSIELNRTLKLAIADLISTDVKIVNFTYEEDLGEIEGIALPANTNVKYAIRGDELVLFTDKYHVFLAPSDSSGLFSGNVKLNAVEFMILNNFYTNNVTDATNMFAQLSNLRAILVNKSTVKFKNNVTGTNMFKDCYNLRGYYLNDQNLAYYSFDVSQTGKSQAKIASSAGGYFTDLKKISVDEIRDKLEIERQATTLANMGDLLNSVFNDEDAQSVIASLRGVIIGGSEPANYDYEFDISMLAVDNENSTTGDVKLYIDTEELMAYIVHEKGGIIYANEDCSNMFTGFTNLECLTLKNFDVSQVTNFDGMFAGLTNLKSVLVPDGTNWSAISATSVNMFDGCENLVGYWIDENEEEQSVPFNSSATTLTMATIASNGGYFTQMPAQNVIDLSITGWTYGEGPNAPLATARYGNITYTYALGTGSNVGEFSNVVPTNVGDYTVKAYVAGTSSYTEATAFATFTISPKLVTKPTANETVFVYSGEEQTYTIAESDYYTISNNTRTDAGEQTVTVSLNDNQNTHWADNSTDDVTFTFTISPKLVTKPTANETVFVYSGEEQTYTITESDYYTISNNKRTNAGEQIVTVSLKDNANTHWEDNTIDDITFTFRISPQVVENPVITQFEFTYTGEPITLVSLEPNSIYALTSDSDLLTQTEVGTYTIKLALPNANYAWETDDNNDGIIEFEFTIVDSIEPNTLITGQDFYTIISGQDYTDITAIVFANVSDDESYESIASGVGVDVTVNKSGKVNLFKSGTTAYILSMDNKTIYANSDCSRMFGYRRNVESILFNNFNTIQVTDMNHMFYNCSALLSLNVTNFDTSKVTNMGYMFYGCESLQSLDVSHFVTSNVENMSWMFGFCEELETLNTATFDTRNTITLEGMFSGCKSITSLNITNFDTSNVTSMNGMFSGCLALENLDVTHLNTTKVSDMYAMFADCSALRALDVTHFDISQVTDMASLFNNCGNLETIYVGSSWNASNVANSNSMFADCTNLKGFYSATEYNQFDSTKATDKTNAVIATSSNGGYLTDISLKDDIEEAQSIAVNTLISGLEFSDILNTKYYNADNIVFANLSDYPEFTNEQGENVSLSETYGQVKLFNSGNTIYVLSMNNQPIYANPDCSQMFGFGAGKLRTISFNNFDTSMVTNMSYMFSGCPSLIEIDVSNFNTSNVTDMCMMFEGCTSLTYIDLSNFNMIKVTDISDIFNDCGNLETIYVGSNWNTSNVTNSNSMFAGCTKLKGYYSATEYNQFDSTKATDKTYAIIATNATDGFGYLTDINLKDAIEAAKLAPNMLISGQEFNYLLTDAEYIVFANLSDYPEFTNEQGENVSLSETNGQVKLFTSENTIYVLSMNNQPIYANPDCSYMFRYCDNLRIIFVDVLDTTYVTNSEEMFDSDSKLNGYYSELGYNQFDYNEATDITYAKIATSTNGGYFTDIALKPTLENSTLLSRGGNFWYDLSIFSNGQGQEIIFANAEDYPTIAAGDTWINVTQSGIGQVRLFTVDDVTYVLSMNNETIYANPDCSRMFYGYDYYPCMFRKMTFSNFDTRYVVDMNNMFNLCACSSDMTSLDLSGWDVSNVTNMRHMFGSFGYYSLSYIDLTGWDISNVTDLSYMFSSCKARVIFVDSDWDVTNANSEEMFIYCDQLKGYYSATDSNAFDSENQDGNFAKIATSTNGGYFTDINLKPTLESSTLLANGHNFWYLPSNTDSDDIDKVIFANAEDYPTIAAGDTWINVTETGIGAVRLFMNTGNNIVYVLSMNNQPIYANPDCSDMFGHGLSSLSSFDLSNFDTSMVTDMSYMFLSLPSLTSIDLSNFDTSNVTDMSNMFNNCGNLETIYVGSNWNTSNVATSNSMFAGCTNLKGYYSATEYNQFDSTKATDKTYAKIATNATDGFGYLTGPTARAAIKEAQVVATNMLLSGRNFWNIFHEYYYDGYGNDNIIFANAEDYPTIAAGNNWFDVTLNGSGAVRAFSDTDNNVTYFLSMNNSPIYANPDCSEMFYGYDEYPSNFSSIIFDNFDTSYVVNMQKMFSSCTCLGKENGLDLSGWNTSNVTDMSYMFEYSEVSSLNLSGWDTSNLTDMRNMFCYCNYLETLDLSSFNTSNVIDMSYMFWNCGNLETIYVGANWNTSNVTDSEDMFVSCYNLKGFYNATEYCEFDDSKAIDKTYAKIATNAIDGFGYLTNISLKDAIEAAQILAPNMLLSGPELNAILSNSAYSDVTSIVFGNKSGEYATSVANVDSADIVNVTKVPNGNINLYKVGDTIYILHNDATGTIYANENCSGLFKSLYAYSGKMKLESISFENFNTSYVTNMSEMFSYDSVLTNMNLDGFDTSKVTNMSYMFNQCRDLISVDLSSFDTSNVTNMSYMFEWCETLTSIDVSSFNTSKVTDMSWMFSDCMKLETLDVTNFNTSNVANMEGMFGYCTALGQLDVSEFDTSNVTNMASMFSGCVKCLKLDLSNFDTSMVTDMSYMFYDCGAYYIDVSEFNTTKVTDMNNMFRGCYFLGALDLSNFDTSNVTDMSYMFEECVNLSQINLTNFNTSKVTDMGNMFNDCHTLINLDLSSFDTSKVTNMQNMFYSNEILEIIYVGENWNTDLVTNSYSMFENDESLKGYYSLSEYNAYNSSQITASQALKASVDGGYLTDISTDVNKTLESGVHTKYEHMLMPWFMLYGRGTVTDLVLGYKNDYLLTIENVEGVDVSCLNDNTIKYYTIGNTGYILSEDDTEIYTPYNSKFLFNYIISNYYYDFAKLASISFDGVNTTKTTNMSYMFGGCSSLSELDLSSFDMSHATTDHMFYSCSSLNVVELPTTMISIGEYIFSNCSSLTSLEIPSSVTSIANSAFYSCSSLTNIEIPSGVTNIGENAFYGCSSLESITFDANSQLSTIGQYAFRFCRELTNIEIPNEVTSIDNSAFNGCYRLIEVINKSDLSITAGETTNGYVAYYALKVVSGSEADNYESKIQLIDGVYYYVDEIENLFTAVNCESNLTNLIIDSRCTSINQFAFVSRSELASVTLPIGVTSIGNSAFSNCSCLTSIELSSSVTSIGASAFNSCSGLTSIEIPNKVTSIGNYIFSDCSNLSSVTFEENSQLTSISDYAFSGCGSLISIELPISVTSIGVSAFNECSSLTGIELPINVTSIGNSAFSKCSSLASIEIPISIISIGNSAFSSCTSLTSVAIPSSVTTIGNAAFSGCSHLVSLTLPFVGKDATTSIASSSTLFGYIFGTTRDITCTQTKQYSSSSASSTYYIPTSLTSVTILGGKLLYGAFYNCSRITTFVIGENVTSIGQNAFYGTSSRKKVYYCGTETEWNNLTGHEYVDSGTIYFYSETEPTESGNYWHYDTDGVTPVSWA